MLKPWPGIPIALLVIILSLGAIVGGGKALRATLLLPLVNKVLVPFFKMIFASIIPEGILLNVLIGEYGIFVIGFEWIISLILPYVLLFYIVFSFLEDSGFLPRLSVLFDSIMRKMGIQGGSMITILMGYGCAVPAIIGSRTATTKKERLIIATSVCFAVPCISQTGALISLFAGFSPILLVLMILLSLVIMITVSSILGRVLKGNVDPMVIEIPNLLMPNGKAYLTKLKIRMKHFLLEAEVPMLISIVIAAVLKETGLLAFIAVYLEPLVSGWLGLPKEAVIALILGVVRREMAVAPLLAIEGLTALQAFVGGTVALLYLPCLSVFGILSKEFNAKVAVAIGLSTTVSAFIVAGLINQIAHLIM
ncbi:Ferrous iron transport protein B homolog [Proteiniborus sp. DW1]|uniref:nucleoside recognition domain-containing protein n=1 Tax=Proteiniborus sp. DW1 TaxID=1889883 RepID=UPI00092DEBB2|nr:nucleoside recognition domain-containing protein [Proteiniborus sp. DW1]SCG84307.1 Ferrous iron transport protein B homolog [Proteiniborus sp. DW1]